MAIQAGSGEVPFETDLFARAGTPKPNTSITKGAILVNPNGAGYRPCVDGDHGPFFVALEDAASAASPSPTRILERGSVYVTAENSVDEGEWVTPANANAGECDPWASPAGTPNLKQIVGRAREDITGGSLGIIMLGY